MRATLKNFRRERSPAVCRLMAQAARRCRLTHDKGNLRRYRKLAQLGYRQMMETTECLAD